MPTSLLPSNPNCQLNVRAKSLKSKASFRGHLSPVSAMLDFYLPSGFSYTVPDENCAKAQDPNEVFALLETTLITGDESGWVFWWDINTRRPIGSWKAHDGPVISIVQPGLRWKKVSDGNMAPLLTEQEFGKLLTHGKDGEVIIWDLFELIRTENGNGYLWKRDSPLQRKVFATRNDISKWISPDKLFDMPVNPLNFSNVAFCENKLVAPSTQDSNCFDVYEISKVAKVYSLKRLYKAVSAVQQIEKNDKEINIQYDEESGRDFGVVMKIVWINDNVFSVGYESGHVVSFNLTNDSLRVISVNSSHYPYPILALHYDPLTEKLLAGSASSTITIDSLDSIENSEFLEIRTLSQTYNVKHKGISDISTRPNTVVLITWDGFSRFYKYDESGSLQFCKKVKKTVPSIDNMNSSTSAMSESQQQSSAILIMNKPQFGFSFLKSKGTLRFDNGRSKNIVKFRSEQAFDHCWLFTGYKDGKVTLQEIETEM
ncbi:unnamed protein product [Ambrosiozyma monospora]|uniref:Unnamed protein product n=1 Tax=Ambrosiozyma monospora TaxID=43982 RepID=A0ACB5T2F9_AMBMO|nr:unnamed protein product [Ambrosiozyma monospora]